MTDESNTTSESNAASESNIASEFLLLKSSLNWLRVWQFLLLIGLCVNAGFIIQVPLSSIGTAGASNPEDVEAAVVGNSVVETSQLQDSSPSPDATSSSDFSQITDNTTESRDDDSDEGQVTKVTFGDAADLQQRQTEPSDTGIQYASQNEGVQLGAVVRGTTKAWLRVAQRRASLAGSLASGARPQWPSGQTPITEPSQDTATTVPNQATESNPDQGLDAQDPATDSSTKPLIELTAKPPKRFTIRNSEFNGGEVRFLLDRELKSLAPGESLELTEREACSIEFHRGGDFGTFQQSLSPGGYEFQVTDRGWTIQAIETQGDTSQGQ